MLADRGVAALAAAGVDPVRALGASTAAITARTAGSPNCVDGRFDNPEPAADVAPDVSVLRDMLRRPGRPRRPVTVLTPAFAANHYEAAVRDLAATWLGHASVLVELDGTRVLTDPVLSRRCSPSQLVGPGRLHRSPATVGDLPALDVVLLSHDHYDHLDLDTIVDLATRQPAVRFVAPIGVGAHLAAWGIAEGRIFEADLGDTVELALGDTTLHFTCGPARHFSGRGLTRNQTLWASWAVVGPRHRFFFSGDTGYTERLAELAHLGPFPLTLFAVGAYDPMWPDIHLNPEEALAMHRMIADADSLLLPIHWGTFSLARHPWGEPIARLYAAAGHNGRSGIVVPPPGGDIDVLSRTGSATAVPTWWEASS